MQFRHRFRAILVLAVLLAAGARAEDTEIATVFSRTHNGYERRREGDGSFRPETYVFGEGEFMSGGLKDESIDHLPFMQVAQILAAPLAQQNYRPAFEGKKTDLLIMVYWGRTSGLGGVGPGVMKDGLKDTLNMGQVADAADADVQVDSTTISGPAARAPSGGGTVPGVGNPQAAARDAARAQAIQIIEMQNRIRDRATAKTATLLGYAEELARTGDARQYAGVGNYRQDLLSDLEEDRYYVVLLAFDYRTLEKKKEHKLLWVTRFSLRARGHAFDRNLSDMARNAAKYFGRDSRGLQRQEIPVGKVEVGKAEVVELGVPPAKPPAEKSGAENPSGR